jgi:hypothetical protein
LSANQFKSYQNTSPIRNRLRSTVLVMSLGMKFKQFCVNLWGKSILRRHSAIASD